MSGGFGRGVRSFMDGALAGVDLRTKWDDRKRRQKIEDEEIEWRREDRRVAAEDRERRRKAEDEGAAWVREDRQYTRKARGIAESERARTARTRDEDDAALADAFTSAQDSYKKETESAAKAAVPLGATMPKIDVEPLPGGALDKALNAPETERPAQKPARSIVPTVRTKDDDLPAEPAKVDPSAPMAEAPSIADATANQQASLLSRFNPFGAAAAAEVPTRDQAAASAAAKQPVPGAGVGDYAAAVAGPVVKAARGLVDAATDAALPAAMRAMQKPPPAGPAPTPAPAAPGGAPREPDPMLMAIAMSNGENVQPQQRPAAATPAAPARLVPPGIVDAGKTPGVPGAAMAEATPPKAVVPSDVPNAARPPVTPSVEIAAAVSKHVDTKGMRREKGLSTPAKPDTPTESTVKARTFMQIYRAEAVPEIVQHYLERGDIEKARAFDEWARSEDTREGMEAWAKGAFAASKGDLEGFLDHMADSYNADGYYDDGYEMVREGSGFTKAPDGSIIGGKITLRDKRTGKTRVETFEGSDELIEMGITKLAPESAFDDGVAQVRAAGEFEKGQAEKELDHARSIEIEGVRAGIKGKTPQQEIEDTYAAMAKEDVYGNGFNALPEAEKQAAVSARIQSMKAIALGRVPVSRSQIPVAPVNF